MDSEIFEVWLDRIKNGFIPVEINPDGVNLNRSYYKIPDIEIMREAKKLGLLNKSNGREVLYDFYLNQQNAQKNI